MTVIKGIGKQQGFRPLGLDDKMPFGKYKGDELWLVIETDTQYITWLIEEADMDFQLDNDAYEHYLKR